MLGFSASVSVRVVRVRVDARSVLAHDADEFIHESPDLG